ncbi:MAG: glycosyltransferase family 4 protein, partial [Candidatus Lindowbacteria bacterium]|nr:glycosyltransferase family 4 protein [Candidatus Lindowbacteria bacterium]
MDKRIVFVNKYGGYFGGVERYIRDAAMGLRDAGWQVFGLFEHRTNKQADFDVPFETCWYLEDDSKSLNKIKDVHIPTAFIHKFDNLTILEKIAAQFMSVRMVHDHDLYCLRGHKYFPIGRINCHREYSWFCALCSGMVKKNGNGRFHFVSLSKKKKEFELNRKMDTLVTASEFMKRNLVQNGFPSSKIQVIYPDYRFSAKPQLSEGLNIPVQLLFVGQLISGKGVVLLLRALENVGCKFHLDIVGTGNAVTQIQHLIQSLGLSRNTTLHGWVDPLELDEFYRRCDIVLVPSR